MAICVTPLSTSAGLIDDHFAFAHAEGQEVNIADAKSGLCTFACTADLATTHIEPPAFWLICALVRAEL